MITVCGRCGADDCTCPPPTSEGPGAPPPPPPPPPPPGEPVVAGLDYTGALLGAAFDGLRLESTPAAAEASAREALGAYADRRPEAVRVAGVAHRGGRLVGLALALGRHLASQGGD